MESTSQSQAAGLPHRRRVGVTILAVVALVFIPAIVFASHQFNDVATGASYHDDVEALVGAGITSGCGGGNYCPNNAVTRGQMAQFMNRGLGIATSSIGEIPVADAGKSFVATISIPAGAQSGGTGYVTVTADLMWFGAASSCPCGISFGIASLLSKGDVSPTVAFLVPADSVNGFGANAGSLTWTFEVPTGTEAQFGLFASSTTEVVTLGEPGTTGVSDIFQGTMTAQYSPFGSAGAPAPLGGETGGVIDGVFGPINLNEIGE